MNTELWKPKLRIEHYYQKSIQQAMKSLEKSLIGLTNPIDILRTLKSFTNSLEFNFYATTSAKKMVTQIFTDSGHTWRTAAKKNSLGRDIYDLLKNEMYGPMGTLVNYQIKLNSELIKSIPSNMTKYASQYILEGTMEGKRASDIAEELLKLLPSMSKNKAQLIARTETSKASTAISKARSQMLGLNWYQWRTSQDERVRDSHRHMEGVLVNWNEPPSPEELDGKKSYGHYNAGDIFNCRCYPEVVINIDLVQFPHKVYHQGRIQIMSKKQFLRIGG